jgi:hypothetical protein
MAENKPNPDWRQANKKNAGATPAAGAGGGKRGWQKQTVQASGPRKPWSRGSKLGLAILLLSFFVGGVYVVIEWLRPISPACLVLMGASYDDNLAVPHNAFGWKNLDDLDKLKDEIGLFSDAGKPTLLHRSPEMKGADIWKKEWDIFSRKIREETLVLFLALHGAADAKEPYFFLNSDQGYARLPVAEVFKELDGPLGKKNVVLLIEPALARANWSTGVLDNDFVAKLLDMKSKIKSKNLFILCASDVHQVSWPCEEWQQTVFGHFVIEGLRGAADSNNNTRVSVDELFKYVHDKVVSWSHVNRGVEQKPVFIGDVELAEKVEINQVAAPYKERSGDAPGLNFNVPESLELAWKGWQALRKMTPHPSVYSPALWRRYQDLLVRYEQLLRAGDPTRKAGDVASKLAAMKRKLESEARFDVADPAMSLALPMAEAFGVPLDLPDDDVKKGLQNVWDAPKDEARPGILKDLIESLKKRDVRPSSSQLRVQLYRTFLRFLEQSPLIRDSDLTGRNDKDEARSKVETLLDLYDVNLNQPRPAEVHYQTMLLKDVSRTPAPDMDLLRQALKVRQLAERAALGVPDGEGAHPYSEVLLPWNRERIAKADALRRPGEDYLFGSSKDDWEKARRFLDQAQTGYREVQKESDIYRAALDVRDRSLADLPYFALWVANQRVSSDKGQADRVDDWGKQVTLLAQRAEALHAELAREKAGLAVLREYAGQVSDIRKNLSKFVGDEIDNANQDTHSHPLWFDREALLSVPPLLPDALGANVVEVRLAMLRFNRFTSSRFFKSNDAPKAFGGSAKEDADVAAKRNMHMAMAAFKPFWPLEVARVETETVPVVADTIGGLAKRWPQDINEALSGSLKEGDLAQAATMLRKADFLARGLPGGFEDKAEPMSASQALRSLRMHDLLLAQARRVLVDHWYSEVQDGDPYYETSARGYLNIARTLVEVKGETMDSNKLRLAQANRLLEAVKTVGLRIDGKESDFWTSEKEFPVRWIVKTPDDPYLIDPRADDTSPPPAVAVTWRQLEGGSWKDGVETGQRKPLELLTQQKRDFNDTYYLLKANSSDAPLKATYSVLLRGQRKSAAIEISQKDPDLIVHDFPKPQKSFIKVRMDPKFNYGAISIALDISGSMIWTKDFGIGPTKRARLEFAIEALEKTLRLIPDGTDLSLLAFITKDREKTPVIVDIQKPSRWSQDKLDGVIERIRTLAGQAWPDVKGAHGSTPLAYTIVECAKRGFPDNFRGPKVILALSDGDDTSTDQMLEKDRVIQERQWRNPNDQKTYDKNVRNFIANELANRDFEVHVVCFLDRAAFAAEARNAEAQFRIVETFKNPGTFVIEPDPLRLAKEMERAIRPRLIVERGTDNPPGFLPDGEFISLPRDEHNWIQIPKGQYTIRIKGSPPRDLVVNHGDMIALIVKRDPVDLRKIVYEREPYADFLPATVPLLADGKAMDGRYRVTVMQRQATAKTNQLTKFVAVEEPARSSQLIQQSTPKFAWIESKPKTQAPPRMLRWYRDYGYPTLGYRIHGYDWPAPAAVVATPEVSVWLTDGPENEAFAKQLQRSIKKTKADTVRLDADQFAVIEDVTLEDKEVAPDHLGKVGAKLASKQCIVVRVEHAKGRPVFVQLQGGQYKGEEHHFFNSANKYTAMFWDLTNTSQENLSFNIIFLDALKKDVTPTTFILPIGNANFPQPFPLMGN